MFSLKMLSYGFGALLVSSLVIPQANALPITQTGTFGSDNQVYQYLLNIPTSTTVIISTDSYGGGTNMNGTTTPAGGFVPVLTLFSTVSPGNVIAFDGADGVCHSGAKMDTSTHMCDDAYIQTPLAAGNYILDLTEFPNVANGTFNSNPQFLFGNDPTATGDVCGVAGGQFLQADVAPCVQRTGNFLLNIASVPEPATLWLALPVLAVGLLRRKRISSRL